MFSSLRRGVFACAFAVLSACGGGGGGGAGPNHAPHAVAIASGAVTLQGAQVKATVDGTVHLDASASTDEDRDPLSYQWSLTSQPPGGSAPASFSGASFDWTPAAMGTYAFTLRVSDNRGGSSTQDLSVVVDNHAPVTNLVVSAQFTAVPATAPTQPVTIGANIVVDATASTDPDGDPVTVSFSLEQRPTGSAAALTLGAKTARFVPDVVGAYTLRARGVDPSGAAFESVYTFDASNRAPNPVVVASASAATLDAGGNSMQASVGYDLLLNGSSTDADGDAIVSAWLLTARPAGSAVTLSSATGASTAFTPDLLGDYVVTLTATDTKGAKSTFTTTVHVNNRRPVANISTNATPSSLPSVPNFLVPLGTQVTLRGNASSDADGDPLTYLWTVAGRPAGSTAALSSGSVTSPIFTADKEGSYIFRLRVTDNKGAYSERTIGMNVGTHAPVAVVDRSNLTVLVGATANLSAALSFDDDGDPLSYQWTLDAKPAGSTAAFASPATPTASLAPDVPGTYVAAVRVSDGQRASIAYVTVRALAQFQSSVSLNFVPGLAHYSTGLDKLVLTSVNPHALRIVDPFAGMVRSVPLPAAVKSLNLSADGKLAAVLHEGVVSLIDIDTGTLIRSTATGGSQTDAFVTNAGIVFLIGQTGGQWVSEPVVTLDGRTGVRIAQIGGWGGFAFFYGTQLGVMADRLNKVFFVALGLSPSDISYFTFDRDTSQVTGSGESPYHGDYGINAPLYLSGDQGLVFTWYGTFFNTSDLRYAGQLVGASAMQSFSHSSAQAEALVLQSLGSSTWPYTGSYPPSYKRFTGSLLLPDTDLPLPLIGGSQSYGIKIFHSGSGAHVVLVQTGTDQELGAGANYYVIVR